MNSPTLHRLDPGFAIDRPLAPASTLVYEALVEVAPRRDIGESPLGHRYIVDITGGRFEGERLRGRVLPGGADRQLLRHDGIKQLEAIYELETDDGVIISVRNRVLIDDPGNVPRYAHSHIEIDAPAGRYDWLNRRRYVGTLLSMAPRLSAVMIGVYQLV